MFISRKLRKELNDIWTELVNQNNKIQSIKAEIAKIEENYGISIAETSNTLLAKVIPALNKVIKNLKDVDYETKAQTKIIVKLCEWTKLPKAKENKTNKKTEIPPKKARNSKRK